jgi:mRNA-degrading endonuclease RelE of RelBE toxin-antitoxin system
MTNAVIISKTFQREAKDLLKKFHTLKGSIDGLIEKLIDNPYCGEPYGQKIFKIRLSDKSKGGGKSGGFRVLYYHIIKTDEGITTLLMSIFDKSDKDSISKTEALKILSKILDEM